MRELYPRLEQADILVLATPVYVPLPGDFQHFLNRLSPLIEPVLTTHRGRTRARFRDEVAIRKVVAVVVGGWWEKENLDPVVRIVRELAENAGAEFAGAVLRPHAEVMRREGQVTEDGQQVLGEVEKAGWELIRNGVMDGPTLDAIGRPLISRATYNKWFSQSASTASEDSAD
jgi:multimeric flavodoxin WrbA